MIILNDPPYGTDAELQRPPARGVSRQVRGNQRLGFSLMGDAASCAVSGQTTPNGYYNIERMLKPLAGKGAPLGVCGSCMDARGIKAEMLAEGAHRSSMAELTSWTEAANKVLLF